MTDDALQSRYETPGESPGFLLWQVSNLWQRRQRTALQPLGLTHVQYVLLASLVWLSRDGEPVTQIRLAQHAGTDPMMTSQVLRTLEKKGLIVREPHPRDTRAKFLRATAAGQELAARATAVVEQVDEAFFGGTNETAAETAARFRELLRAQPGDV